VVNRFVVRSGTWLAFVSAMGCNVSSPPKNTGGVVLEGGTEGTQTEQDAAPETGSTVVGTGDSGGDSGTNGGDSGTDSGEGGAVAVCPGALSVVCTDYTTSNIEIANLDGTSLSGSFVSSGSTPTGLTTALSGDVDVPFVPPASGRVVIIDRYGTDVLTWMNLSSASVLAQLVVGTGFNSNPQDYIETNATQAYVSRYGTNASPGQQMYDEGGDLLILNTSNYSITGRIAMPEENTALEPCPAGMNWIGSDVVVTLQRFSSDFSMVGDGRFVGVSPATNSIAWTVNITGLQDCGRVYVSPSGKVGAIACSGQPDSSGNYDPTGSDIVLYDLTQSPPVETKRLGLGASLTKSIQQQLSFASETTILALTYGNAGAPTSGDTAIAVDIGTADSGAATVTQLAAETTADVYAGPFCSPGCSEYCILADSNANAILRWQFANGTFTAASNATVDTTVGLPPIDIGGLL
jgi:hypothetical protein